MKRAAAAFIDGLLIKKDDSYYNSWDGAVLPSRAFCLASRFFNRFEGMDGALAGGLASLGRGELAEIGRRGP